MEIDLHKELDINRKMSSQHELVGDFIQPYTLLQL
jgi:hypothetical protein